MSKHQALRDAIIEFQPGGADAPILYSSIEMNEKSLKALLGRKLKPRHKSLYIALLIWAFVIIAASSVVIIAFGQVGAPSFAAFVPLFIIILIRTTIISVTDDGLDFYFIEAKRGSKFVVYDKLSLPYDRMTNVKVRAGRFNTSFTFEFTSEDKKYKLKTTVPNKLKKMNEQAENQKQLLEKVSHKANGER